MGLLNCLPACLALTQKGHLRRFGQAQLRERGRPSTLPARALSLFLPLLSPVPATRHTASQHRVILYAPPAAMLLADENLRAARSSIMGGCAVMSRASRGCAVMSRASH